MVNPGGKSTMLGHWRIVLRQAEEAARVGRFDEAFALASRPDVADHHNAVQLRGRLALDLVARATRRGAADDLGGAIEDLDLAERMGARPTRWPRPGSAWPTRSPGRSGPTSRPASRRGCWSGSRTWPGTRSAARRCAGPARSPRPGRRRWTRAAAASSAGAGPARPRRAAAGGAGAIGAEQAVAAAKAELESRQKAATPKVEALYAALAEGKWPTILAAAEAVLETVPEHPAARQARTRAWQQIAAIGPAAAAQWPARGARGAQAAAGHQPPPRPGRARRAARDDERDRPEAVAEARPRRGRRHLLARRRGVASRRRGVRRTGRPRHGPPAGRLAPAGRPCPPAGPRQADGPKGRFLLWVDAVGGYLVCMDDQIVLGRAGADSNADVPLMGDLSRNHATLVRDGDGYVLQAHHATFVNGKAVAEQAVLRDGDVIRLGSTVELEFRQPSPVSATARLAIVSRHRLPLAVDGVLLMAETCIVGEAAAGAHPGPGADRSGRPLSPGRRCGAAPRRLRCRREDLRRPRPR